MPRNSLLLCGVLSSVLYILLNVVCVLLYPGYSWTSQTVSELSAIGAPTRTLWVSIVSVYSIFVIGFGVGILRIAGNSRSLRLLGILLIVNIIIGLFWPPMHQRTALAAGEKSLTDTLHIVFTMVTVPLMIVIIIVGAKAQGKLFRLYSILTLLVLVIAGVLTGLQAPNIDKNLSTPLIGIWERVNIGAYMVWVAALSISLVRHYNKSENKNRKPEINRPPTGG